MQKQSILSIPCIRIGNDLPISLDVELAIGGSQMTTENTDVSLFDPKGIVIPVDWVVQGTKISGSFPGAMQKKTGIYVVKVVLNKDNPAMATEDVRLFRLVAHSWEANANADVLSNIAIKITDMFSTEELENLRQIISGNVLDASYEVIEAGTLYLDSSEEFYDIPSEVCEAVISTWNDKKIPVLCARLDAHTTQIAALACKNVYDNRFYLYCHSKKQYDPEYHVFGSLNASGGKLHFSLEQEYIPDLNTIRSGAAAGATAYQKPAGGIPSSDMTEAVQTSLGKADTALQEHQSLDNYYTKGETDAAIKAVEQTVPNDISRTQTDATIVHKDNQGNLTALFYIRQATQQLAGLMTALDKQTLNAIDSMIPSAASAQNQLADKTYVNTSIETSSATFRGTYNLVTDLGLTVSATHSQVAAALLTQIATADKNDYAFVQIPDSDSTPTVIASIDRYKHTGSAWEYEYTLNNSGFTAEQWAAINSGITGSLVEKLSALPTNTELNALLAAKQETLVSGTNIKTVNGISVLGSGDIEIIPGGIVETTYAALKTLRDGGTLVPGTLYRITDFVTTANTLYISYARSAVHPFDIVVMALDANTLSQEAYAMMHDGDTYFQNSNIAAWKLRYTLDNVQWSNLAGTYCQADESGFRQIGTFEAGGRTWLLWHGDADYEGNWYTGGLAASEDAEVGTPMYAVWGDPSYFDPEMLELVGEITSTGTVSEDGKGTILWMKDEFDNECPYDFKSIQFKRWLADDLSGIDRGLNGKYMISKVSSVPKNLAVDDGDDFIWAYTFSSDATGGEQTDYSLGGHKVHGNIFKPLASGELNNNVMFGGDCYGNVCEEESKRNTADFGFSLNSIGPYTKGCAFGDEFNCNVIEGDFAFNSIGSSCYENHFAAVFQGNSLGSGCDHNFFGALIYNNIIGSSFRENTVASNFIRNTIGNNFENNFVCDGFEQNTVGSDFRGNIVGQKSYGNQFASNLLNSIIGSDVKYVNITGSARYVQVQSAIQGSSINSRFRITFASNKNYVQVATKDSSQSVKVWIPGDLSATVADIENLD